MGQPHQDYQGGGVLFVDVASDLARDTLYKSKMRVCGVNAPNVPELLILPAIPTCLLQNCLEHCLWPIGNLGELGHVLGGEVVGDVDVPRGVVLGAAHRHVCVNGGPNTLVGGGGVWARPGHQCG